MINCFQICLNFAFKFKLRRYTLQSSDGEEVIDIRPGNAMPLAMMPIGRGSHSSTFRLNVRTFCGIRRVPDYFPCLLDRGTRGGVTNTAEAELRSGRV
jgi:hypothetical protein